MDRYASVPDNPAYFRQQAEHHRQLAIETRDPQTAKALRMIAEEYTVMAMELEAKEAIQMIETRPRQR